MSSSLNKNKQNEKPDKHLLKLCNKPVEFEAVNEANQIYFDDILSQVFAVRSGGTLGVVVSSLDEQLSRKFKMPDKGDIIAMKFNPSLTILAIQRSPNSVEFLNFNDKREIIESTNYSQTCKGKNAIILGYNWITNSDIIFITDSGLEIYQVFADKQTVRAIKTQNFQVNWFCYNRQHSMLILSTGSLGNILYPFIFQGSQVTKLQRIEIDVVHVKPPSLVLQNKHVSLLEVYDNLHLAVFDQKQQVENINDSLIVINLYLLTKESLVKKLFILETNLYGNYALSCIDNLIVIHILKSDTCLIFDIASPGKTDNYGITCLQPITNPLPIKSIKNLNFDTATWLIFPPNIVIDARIGYLWAIELDLESFTELINDQFLLISILLRRKGAKNLVLEKCKKIISPEMQYPLALISRIFDTFNRNYVSYQNFLENGSNSSNFDAIFKNNLILDQGDLYSKVFYQVFNVRKDIPNKYVTNVLSEYIKSLNQFGIPISHFIIEEFITRLTSDKRYFELEQLIERKVLGETKPLACLLLSLESTFNQSCQLAMKMLSRENIGSVELVEIMLSKQQVIPALRYIKKSGLADTISARKFLDAALATNDPWIFHAVFLHFEQRNLRLRNDSKFVSGEQCEVYVAHFEKLFGSCSAILQNQINNF